MSALRRFACARSLAAALAACGLAGARAPEAHASALYAERITAENIEQRAVGGPDAIGGLGDWALGNGTLCAVVSDPAHEAILSAHGGVLVDLGHCRVGDDQWNVLHPLLNASRETVPRVESIHGEVGEGEARIVTVSSLDGIEMTTHYRLGVARPDVLLVHGRIRRLGPEPTLRFYADVILHGNGSLMPFTLQQRRPEASPGFAHPFTDPDDWLAMARAMLPADVHVLVGAELPAPGVAYGVRLAAARRIRADGVDEDLPVVSLNGEHFSLLGVLPRPFYWGERDVIGALQLLQIGFMDLAVGETLEIEREIRVGRRADVASVTDALWPDAPQVVGRVSDPSARVHVHPEAGGALTEVRPDRGGAFSFRAPPGRYRLVVVAPGERRSERLVEVGPASQGARIDLGTLDVGAVGRVRLPRGHAMRLTFRGLGGTRDPVFGDTLLGLRVGDRAFPSHGASSDVSLGGTAFDPGRVLLAAGRYRVYASRGPEWTVTSVDLEVKAGEQTVLEIAPPVRALATPGWLSADLHVHAQPSDDSTLSLERRVAALVAEGLDVAVATEHDRIADYGPTIRRLGVADRLASVVGSEVTSTSRSPTLPYTSGHSNAMPLALRPHEYRAGALRGEDRRLREIIGELRSLGGERIFQLNHPRSRTPGDAGNYFEHLGVAGEPFDPALPLDAAPNRVLLERDGAGGHRDLDFDAVELMNGPSLARYRLMRADWLSLLLQGEVRTGTANADSHHMGEIAGLPRNYLRVEDDRIDAFHDDVLVGAIRSGALYGTTGPLLDVRLGDAQLGERFAGREGTLEVTVRAAPWVPVSQLHVRVDGRLERSLPVVAGEPISVPLRFERDAFVTVEVEGRPDATYAAIYPRAAPYAFSNPIFVDADGDGRWTAPGLPTALPQSILDPAGR